MQLRLHWQPETIARGSDTNVGARLVQVTSAALISHNVYCEERYTSADGRYLAILRSAVGTEPDEQLWIADLETGQVAPTGCLINGYPASNLFSDALFFETRTATSDRLLMRLDLAKWELEEVGDLSACPRTRYGVCSVSPDERYFLGNFRVEGDIWGLYRVDLSNGSWEVIHTHEHICNPHQQFEPRHGRQVLVQLNWGSIVDEEYNFLQLVGEQGATLYVLDIETGAVQYLPVGKPHTGPVTGHECWVGDTGRIILTTSDALRGAVYLVAPGDERARCLWRGLGFGHISASVNGRYFVVDDFTNGRIYVGSIATGRLLPLCDTGATCASPQYTHPHPYLTPGSRHVIFNSDRRGLGQVWAAEVPDWFLVALDDPLT
ncbi:MAG: hypothetical protein HPY69_07505 [Armatimonadetes bacterium]|nr:hypothetical protein [Armatimonadota bacterium]